MDNRHQCDKVATGMIFFPSHMAVHTQVHAGASHDERTDGPQSYRCGSLRLLSLRAGRGCDEWCKVVCGWVTRRGSV